MTLLRMMMLLEAFPGRDGDMLMMITGKMMRLSRSKVGINLLGNFGSMGAITTSKTLNDFSWVKPFSGQA